MWTGVRPTNNFFYYLELDNSFAVQWFLPMAFFMLNANLVHCAWTIEMASTSLFGPTQVEVSLTRLGTGLISVPF